MGTPISSEISESYNKNKLDYIYNLGKDISKSVACLEPKIEADYGEIKIDELLSKEDQLYLKINEKFQKTGLIKYASGRIKAIVPYAADLRWTGMMYSWYEDGRFLGCALLERGVHKGSSIAFHKNGKMRAFASFKSGLQHGYEFQFDTLGLLKSAVYFSNGMESGSFNWDPSTGTLLHHTDRSVDESGVHEAK